jgi:hypothetical protein
MLKKILLFTFFILVSLNAQDKKPEVKTPKVKQVQLNSEQARKIGLGAVVDKQGDMYLVTVVYNHAFHNKDRKNLNKVASILVWGSGPETPNRSVKPKNGQIKEFLWLQESIYKKGGVKIIFSSSKDKNIKEAFYLKFSDIK